MRRALSVLTAAALFAGWVAAIVFPLPAAAYASDTYLCHWETGAREEGYASAYAALVGATEAGVLLEREGMYGTIAPTPAYSRLFKTLREGSLPQLLTATAEGLSRIERAAVWRTFSKRAIYADEWFAWTGKSVERVQPAGTSETLLLFSDPPSPAMLCALGVQRLVFRDAGSLSARDLIGTQVAEAELPAPYVCTQGAVSLDTAGGRRIVCGLPAWEELVLPDADFADEGALLACEALRSVSVPFAGSAKNSAGSGFVPQFAHLFSTGEAFRVPASLKKVTVRGGALLAYAFYACPHVEEVDACAVEAEAISRQAFLGMDGLRFLHCPRSDLELTGAFRTERLSCGCTLYVRD